jgi:cation transporter-like permease
MSFNVTFLVAVAAKSNGYSPCASSLPRNLRYSSAWHFGRRSGGEIQTETPPIILSQQAPIAFVAIGAIEALTSNGRKAMASRPAFQVRRAAMIASCVVLFLAIVWACFIVAANYGIDISLHDLKP